MSPERATAENTFQLCRRRLAVGIVPLPKRSVRPSGSSSSSVPCSKRCNKRTPARAARGISASRSVDTPLQCSSAEAVIFLRVEVFMVSFSGVAMKSG